MSDPCCRRLAWRAPNVKNVTEIARSARVEELAAWNHSHNIVVVRPFILKLDACTALLLGIPEHQLVVSFSQAKRSRRARDRIVSGSLL
jgi:hypothetical protein